MQSVELPLFPGYVFCRFAYSSRMPVLNTPGVNSVVSFADLPAPVADEEIARIRTIVRRGCRRSRGPTCVWDKRRALNGERWPAWKVS